MKSEDTAKFKQIAVCNFDFLLASVSMESSFLEFYSHTFIISAQVFHYCFVSPAAAVELSADKI